MRVFAVFLLCILTLAQTILMAAPAIASSSIKQDASSVVILTYFRIGEDEYPDQNIRMDQFQEHIEELKSGGYTILPLQEALRALETGATLPHKAVVITFEGGFISARDNAFNLLLDQDIPFTVFFNTNLADAGNPQSLSWRDLKSLARSPLVTLGLSAAAMVHLPQAGDETTRSLLNKAKLRFREEIGNEPLYFSYPFGEYSNRTAELVRQAGFKAAFGLQSGTAFNGANMFALPRFSMTERYGSLERLQLVARALPLPVSDLEPADPMIKTTQPVIGFTLDQSLAPFTKELSCFTSGRTDAPDLQILGARVEVRGVEMSYDDRIRINCTMPVILPKTTAGDADEPQSWRWMGLLLFLDTDEHIARPQNSDSVLNPQQDELP